MRNVEDQLAAPTRRGLRGTDVPGGEGAQAGDPWLVTPIGPAARRTGVRVTAGEVVSTIARVAAIDHSGRPSWHLNDEERFDLGHLIASC